MNDLPPASAELSHRSGARRSWRLLGPSLIVVVLLAFGAAVWYIHRLPPKEAVGDAGVGGADAAARRGARGGAAGPVPVAVATVSSQDIRITESELGTVTPLVTVTVQTQVSGQLTRVGFREGQTVRKGDLLAEIDPRPFQAALAQAQGQLLKDQAALDEARMDLARFQQLAEKNSISRQQAEDQKWLVQQDEGAVKVDEAQVATAQINLGYCRIVAPSDGRIGLRLVDPGNFTQVSSSTPLAVITRMQPMAVVFALPEDSLPEVMTRQHGGVTLQVLAYDRSGTHLLDTGTLSAIDSQINVSTGTVNLKAVFANLHDALFPNQFVNVVLRIGDLPGATAVATAAIQRGADGTFAYLVKPDNTVAMTVVTLGPVDGDHAAVLSGLKPGDRVVIDGADKLRNGAQVAIRGGS
jgi:multidrug efflux system membrane fusion protein